MRDDLELTVDLDRLQRDPRRDSHHLLDVARTVRAARGR